MDALTHALESYLSVRANPYSDGIALQVIATVAEHLPRAIADAASSSGRGGGVGTMLPLALMVPTLPQSDLLASTTLVPLRQPPAAAPPPPAAAAGAAMTPFSY